jgi:hypothetical protein
MADADDQGKAGTSLLLSWMVSIRKNEGIHDVTACKTTPSWCGAAGKTAPLVKKIHGKHQTAASMTVHD